MINVGFIGLGIMGTPMAFNLIREGYVVLLHSRSGVPEELQMAGGSPCASPKVVAEQADIIILMLPDTPDVEAVLFGEMGVACGLSSGKTVVDMSSISPVETKIFANRIEELGCDYLDAPVSGGQVGAEQGSLTIMIGGPERAVERIEPLFKVLGKNITHVGGNGDGQTAKVANQIIVALNIEAVAEALVFAQRAGADPVKVREALMGGFASSRVLDVHGERMVHRTFKPGFRIKLHQKDLGLALDSARVLSLALPNTAACQQLFSSCIAHGYGEQDHSALVTAVEGLAGPASQEE